MTEESGNTFAEQPSSTSERHSRRRTTVAITAEQSNQLQEQWKRCSMALQKPPNEDRSVREKLRSVFVRDWLHSTGQDPVDSVSSDFDSEPSEQAKFAPLRSTAQIIIPWIHTPQAQTTFGIVIIVNAFCLAVETDTHDTEDGFHWNDTADRVWFAIESSFLCVFIVELLLRFRADGCRTFRDAWNCFDLLLIFIGAWDTWILQFLLAGDSFVNTSFLRIARLLRLARIAKVFRFFRVLYLLIEGIGNAMKTISWFVVLLIVMLFTFGIFCTVVFGRHPDHPASDFSSVPVSMFTLFQLMTLEGWPYIYERVAGNFPGIWIFFVFFICTANMVLLNMMTGVIVENVLQMAKDEEKEKQLSEEKRQEETMARLKCVFELLDTDNSGLLSRDEVECLHQDMEAQQVLISVGIPVDELIRMYDRMDITGTSNVSLEEFIDECLRYSQGARAQRDLLHVQWDLRKHINSCVAKSFHHLETKQYQHFDDHTRRFEKLLGKVSKRIDRFKEENNREEGGHPKEAFDEIPDLDSDGESEEEENEETKDEEIPQKGAIEKKGSNFNRLSQFRGDAVSSMETQNGDRIIGDAAEAWKRTWSHSEII